MQTDYLPIKSCRSWYHIAEINHSYHHQLRSNLTSQNIDIIISNTTHVHNSLINVPPLVAHQMKANKLIFPSNTTYTKGCVRSLSFLTFEGCPPIKHRFMVDSFWQHYFSVFYFFLKYIGCRYNEVRKCFLFYPLISAMVEYGQIHQFISFSCLFQHTTKTWFTFNIQDSCIYT